ncbi:very short patch repair endonuclease [Cellulomonas sp. NPDC057328]|uniref:very short patch repair endonuclease n=1 Tax=Cellulomonas sp. NPDC057328 TaxID=3346101 RepID=UPI00363C015D
MSRLRRRDNAPELAVRSLLHARGRRYRVVWPIPGQRRRTIEVAFTRRRLAVFIDGCFWRGCPQHGTSPKASAEWWRRKIETNQARDAGQERSAQRRGWTVMRF